MDGGRWQLCLSSGVLKFGSLGVTGDGGERGEARHRARRRRRAVALGEHGIQARHFGGEKGVDAMEHGVEVRELQLLGPTDT